VHRASYTLGLAPLYSYYYLARQAASGMPRGYVICQRYFLYFHDLTVLFETNLRMYWIDLHQLFRIGTYMVGHDHCDLLFAIAQGTLLW